MTVGYSQNSQSATPATVSITARIFKYLVLHTQTRVITYSGQNSTYGYQDQALYDIYTTYVGSPGQILPDGYDGISTFEQVNQTSSNVPISPVTQSGATDGNAGGEVSDTLRLTSNQTLPPNLSIADDQQLTVGGFFIRDNTLNWSDTAVTIGNNGPFN